MTLNELNKMRYLVRRENSKGKEKDFGYIKDGDFYLKIRNGYKKLKNYTTSGTIEEKKKEIYQINKRLKQLDEVDDFENIEEYDKLLSKRDELNIGIKYLQSGGVSRGAGSTSTGY